MTNMLHKNIEEQKNEDLKITGDEFKFPEDNDITDMLENICMKKGLSTVADRYFTPYYRVNYQKLNDDICIRIHSNRICMISLAPSHPLFDKNCLIEKISFKVTDKVDRAENKISGKGKRGAQALQDNSNICIITCSNGDTWPIKCGINGKLIEVNEALLSDPNLIKKHPHEGGYFAIILPNIKLYESLKNSLMTDEQYQAILSDHEAKKKLIDDESHMQLKRSLEVCNVSRENKVQKTN